MGHGCHDCVCPNGCECKQRHVDCNSKERAKVNGETKMKPLVTRLQEEAFAQRATGRPDAAALLEEAIARIQDLEHEIEQIKENQWEAEMGDDL